MTADKDHPLIGMYVIETTDSCDFSKALRISRNMNSMVYDREKVADRFIVKMLDGVEDIAMVLRKLIIGDDVTFISTNPEIVGERKEV